MVNFGLLTAEICSWVWGMPATLNGFHVFGSVTARHSSSGRQPNFAALNRGRHLYSAGRPSRWALAHILVLTMYCIVLTTDIGVTGVASLLPTQLLDQQVILGCFFDGWDWCFRCLSLPWHCWLVIRKGIEIQHQWSSLVLFGTSPPPSLKLTLSLTQSMGPAQPVVTAEEKAC